MAAEKKYTRFWDFYPYYLTEHSDFSNRLLHFIGTAGLLVILVLAILWQKWWMLALIPVCGYGFAWWGIFLSKKTSPPLLLIRFTAWEVIL